MWHTLSGAPLIYSSVCLNVWSLLLGTMLKWNYNKEIKSGVGALEFRFLFFYNLDLFASNLTKSHLKKYTWKVWLTFEFDQITFDGN